MDPVGPWYASYNRLTSGNCAGSTFQGSSSSSPGDFVTHHLASSVNQTPVPSTTSQLLLQAAHTTATLAGQPFSTGGFLSPPPPVGYDVFSPLFHHSNPKQAAAHYVTTTQHRQVLAVAAAAAAAKQNSPESTDVAILRDNYASPHQNFFEQQTPATPVASSSLPWTPHQNNSQLPSPFGILPHESVVPSSPGPPTSKPGTPLYENNFNINFSSSGSDFKSSSGSFGADAKKSMSNIAARSVSPLPLKSASDQTFFQQVPTTFSPDGLVGDYTAQTSNGKIPPLHQQTCIVSTPNNAQPNKDYCVPTLPQALSRVAPTTAIFLNTKPASRVTSFASPPNKLVSPPLQQQQQVVVQTKAQTKVYPELIGHNEQRRTTDGHESGSSQSSPISFSIMDSRNLNYNGNNKPRTPGTDGLQQQSFHVLNQQQQSGYRHYSTNGSTSDSEYHHPGRSKSAASTDSAYSSNTSTQNGSDCGGVVVPRRSSPLQAHSLPSPAYPMYNSPMAATMSSPSSLQQHPHHPGDAGNQCANGAGYKTAVQSQVAPSSPLDVTLPRPSSQGHVQVAYPSVITRTMVSTDNNKAAYGTDSRNYERQLDFSPKQQQVCGNWDPDNRQNRKFPGTTYTEVVQQQQPQQQSPRIVGLNAERQQPTYFDQGQLNLQDLSGCNRGDPMSIVKNLQQQQCQLPQQQLTAVMDIEDAQKQTERKTAEAMNKKRKHSADKASMEIGTSTATNTEYLGRIPPPAHHNVNQLQQQHHLQQPQQQQQQNGYFEFDRWNLAAAPAVPATSTTPKIFPGATTAFASQPHHSGNFGQHQLVMPHHPASYFSSFHLAPGHHPHEFQSVEVAPLAFGETNNAGPHHHQVGTGFAQEDKEEQPKVIVPNIEEELGFLRQSQQPIDGMGKSMKRKDPNSGFMTSYLKFLQGDREPSPPPALTGGRKAAWNRYVPLRRKNEANDLGKSVENGVASTASKVQSQTSTAIDYANDPRYFPLPKERKKESLDSSDDGLSSDDDFPFTLKKSEKKVIPISSPPVNNGGNADGLRASRPEGKGKKGRPIKPGGPTDRKKKAAAAAAAAGIDFLGNSLAMKKLKKTEEVIAASLPRREMSRRKAKEKTSVKNLMEQDGDLEEEEQQDSDSDPAWTPAAKLAGEEEEKRKKRSRPLISKRSRKVLMLDEDDYSSGETLLSQKGKRKKYDASSKTVLNSTKVTCKIDEKLLAAISDDDIDISPFKLCTDDAPENLPGEFVVIKADLGEEFPPLWRIDGKTLLQKYEPFKSNGKVLYRNISTYSGWATQNRHIYQQVPIKFWHQGKLETVVEFLRDEMIVDDSEYIDKSMKETEKYQDNFEVYIQTLISQALDSNFLTEIFQEQDDYFLSNVKTVDDVTEERKKRLLSTTKWEPNFVTAMSTWPCLNVLKDLPLTEIKGKACAGCQQIKIYARVLLYGQPYNATTLEGSPPNTQVPQEKDFLLCRICQAKVELYNKVSHQKYLMFLECARRVGDKRLTDSKKDTTIILNELLADEPWLNQLFKEVRSIWAEIDSLEHQINGKSRDSTSANNYKTNEEKSKPQQQNDNNCNNQQVTTLC